jgi:hypothetical protein
MGMLSVSGDERSHPGTAGLYQSWGYALSSYGKGLSNALPLGVLDRIVYDTVIANLQSNKSCPADHAIAVSAVIFLPVLL